RSRGTEADGGRGRDLIEAGLSEAADRLRAMAKVPASLMPLMRQSPREAKHDGCRGVGQMR
ncbi:MAG: hypothetical protein WA633_20915, partial [Stellaceae bacterium]